MRQLEPELLKRHQDFGYTDEEIKNYFGSPLPYEYDTSGMAKDLIKPPSAPGIHPRVLFYPEGVPALRKKLAETKPGKAQMDGISKPLQQLITGPNAKYGKLYQDATNGIGGPEMTAVEPTCAIEYEAFRCLIDDDEAGAKKVVTGSMDGSWRNDIILTAPGDTENRYLMVRVLNADGQVDPKVHASIEKYQIPKTGLKDISLQRLEIASHSVAPNFKVLLFPYHKGEELPLTTWSADKRNLTVAWSDRKDSITFNPGNDGRTRINISRDNQSLVQLK